MDDVLHRASWRPLPPQQPGDNATNGANRSARILIVEDDFDMCHAILDYLAAQSLRAVAAQDWQEVMRQFAIGEPSLVVLDLCLGNEDGLDLLRHIRSSSDVPVIITTGYRRDEPDVVLVLSLALTTISPSLSDCGSLWPGSGRSCGAGRRDHVLQSLIATKDVVDLVVGNSIGHGGA
jgi:CheY-like chemotaxis protein